MNHATERLLALLAILVLLQMVVPPPAHAYVGPGAGFAFVSSLFTFLAAFLLGLFYLLSAPVRLLIRALWRRGAAKQNAGKVVIVGLDGMDPLLAERFMAQGKLPHFATLKTGGGFAPLATSCPAVSPVAWSSFMTGVDASHHNIFDFVDRDPDTYQPRLSSAQVKGPARTLRIGRWIIPLGGPRIISYRRSRSFWSLLGEHGIFSTVIRVPITFPVERFRGVMLAGMCVPDLRGSQGTFSFFTTDPEAEEGEGRQRLRPNGRIIHTRLCGPLNSLRKEPEELSIPLAIEVDDVTRRVQLTVGREKVVLEERKHSRWVNVLFKAGLGVRVSGICRFYLKSVTPHLELYVTPIQIDPERPALPVSHPFPYSVYLSRLLGRFATLGLAEDTSAVNAGVLDQDGFLEQAYLYHEERERIFFDALEKTRQGVCVCVFDVTDRVQHMFFRGVEGPESGPEFRVLEDLYIRMDGLVGRVLEKLDEDDLLLVMSDHGFAPFKRGVNLNTWLLQNGYLALRDGMTTSGEWFRDVDWTRTRAFALGLAGIHLNRKGREAQGVVSEGDELRRLREELVSKLGELRDPGTGEKAMTRVIETEKDFPGPYASEGPDLLVCYRRGYRNSWEGASGQVTDQVFIDNDHAWSGDHSMDPELVPGVLFANRKLPERRLDIRDLAPTVLELFAVPIPGYIQGQALFQARKERDHA
jgi:predicted AlkP superfamily phosphohydrolase/phosphomutase